MTKKLLAITFSLGLMSTLAQPTIDSISYPRAATYNDTVLRAMVSGTLAPSVGANQTWDYSTLTSNGFSVVEFFDAKDSTAGYTHKMYQFYRDDLVSALNDPIEAYEFYRLGATGFYSAAVYANQHVDNLATITGNTNDSVFFPAQRINADGGIRFMKFPATFQDQWSSKSSIKSQFELTVNAQNLINTPGVFDNIRLQSRSAVGYGMLTLPDENGVPLPPVNAIMINTVQTDIDSIYLGGMPAPASLLSAFGLIQGTSTSEEFTLIYAVGSGSPAVIYELDAQGNLLFFSYRPHAVKEAAKLSINKPAAFHSALYPNPVKAGGTIILEAEKPLYVKEAVFYDFTGKVAGKTSLASKTQKVSLEVPAHLQAGLYQVQLMSNTNQTLVSQTIQVQ